MDPDRLTEMQIFVRDGLLYNMMPINLEIVETDKLLSLLYKLAEAFEGVRISSFIHLERYSSRFL